MNRLIPVLAVTLASLGCLCGGGGGPPDLDISELQGFWLRELDDGTYEVREITGSTYREYLYTVGEQPVVYGGGTAYYEAEATLPGGTVGEAVLVVYRDSRTSYPLGGITYDLVLEHTDKRLVIQSLYADEPVSYEYSPALP